MLEIVIPMLCSRCMNTKVQVVMLSACDQHIPLCFGSYILTLDSECQQIFSIRISVFAHILSFGHLLYSEKGPLNIKAIE